MNRRRTLLCASVLAGYWPPAGSGRLSLRYGGDAAFAPFESLDERDRPAGFQIDLLAELSKVLGIGFEVQLGPWSRTEADFRAGKLDVVAMVETAPRRAWARFVRAHASPLMAIYHPADRPDPQGLPELAGLRIAMLDNDPMRDTVHSWLQGVPDITRVPAADSAGVLQAVRDGRADVALLLRAFGDAPLLHQAEGLRASHLSFPLQSYAFAVAPERTELAARLQTGLDVLEGDGRLEALRVRWLSSHRDIAEHDRLEQGLVLQRSKTFVAWGATGAATLLLGSALWRRNRRVAFERSQRQEAESALSRANALLDQSFERHPDPMLLVESGSGIVRDANASLLRLLDLPADRLIGRPIREMGRHVEADVVEELVSTLAADGSLDATPVRLRRADGDPRDCLVSADRFDIDGRPHVFCIVRDITDQLSADRVLRAGYDQLASELEHAREESRAARAAQAEAEGALQEFTRMVSHDLRSPLNAVQGYSGLLRTRLQSGRVDEAMGFADRIDAAARRMTAMINALRQLAQISRAPLNRQVLDMEAQASDVWDLLSAANPGRQVAFRLEPLPRTLADPELVAQIWQNLLGNAAKYSAKVQQPMVKVDSHADARGTWYRITDNGAGFDMSQAQSLFLPFQRMHSSREFEGTGVGLSVVRRIVDHHGGDVRLRSARGVGTVAEFTLDPLPPGG